MATYHAITAVGEAILGVLKAATPAEFDGIQFLLYQPTDFQNQNTPLPEGIVLYLYHVAVNTTRRNLPPRQDADGKRYRPSLPVDLHYLLIPSAKQAARQQWMLGWCMRALEDTPVLPATVLNHHASEDNTFRPTEAVEVVIEPISLQDIVNIWDAFKPSFQVSIAYVARMVLLDSEIPLSEGVLVQTRGLNVQKDVTP